MFLDIIDLPRCGKELLPDLRAHKRIIIVGVLIELAGLREVEDAVLPLPPDAPAPLAEAGVVALMDRVFLLAEIAGTLESLPNHCLRAVSPGFLILLGIRKEPKDLFLDFAE